MKLQPAAVTEFQVAWKEAFGEEISYEDAEMEARSLLKMYSDLLKNGVFKSTHVHEYGKDHSE